MTIKLNGRLLAFVMIGLFASNSSKAQQKIKTNEPLLPLDPMVRTGKLSNGFTYYIRHNEEPKNRVVMYLANKVGSVLETDDQQGLAHFMEHMSFNGTKHFPKNELVNYLQKSGVRFGADINAYTSFDETVYELPLPSDNPEILKNGIQIMRDWAQDATLDPIEINKERGVILEEKRLGKGAKERMQRQYWPLILNQSRYASRIPIGTDEVLNNFKPETIRKFYHDWYRPDLQALIIVGDIDVNKMEQAIKAKFADLKNPVQERSRTNYTVPLTGKNQFITATDKEMTESVVEVMIKHPLATINTAGTFRAAVVSSLFNQMLSARFEQLSRQPNVPFISAEAGLEGFTGNLNTYTVSISAKPGSFENSFKAAWRESIRVKQNGFTIAELNRAKQSYLNTIAAAEKEKNKTNSLSYVKEYLQYFLKGTAAPGITVEYALAQKDLPGITLADINALVKDYITDKNRDIVVLAPEKDKATLPDRETMTAWMKLVEAENIPAYQDVENKEGFLSVQPAPGKIVGEKHDEKLNITSILLSNGMKVLLKPTPFKNNEILFSGFAEGGSSLYSDTDYQSAAAANAIPSFGAGNYDADQLDKFLAGKQLKIQPFISDRIQGINGESTTKDLETALQMIYAYFVSPRIDTGLFKSMISRSEAGISNRQNDPASVYQDTLSAVLGNHSVRRTGPSLEKLKEIDTNKSYTIFKERFADAANFTFLFVGSLDTTAIKPLLEKYLGSLPSLYKKEQAKDLHISIPPGLITRTVYKGSEPKATVTLVFSGPFDYSFEDKLKLDALKEVLQIRLLERLREDESGVYSPSVRIASTKYPRQRFSFTVSFGCAPQNAEQLITSALDEINHLKTAGPLQVNIDKSRAENLRTMETQLTMNGFWLSYLTGQLQNQEDPHQLDGYSAALNKISSTDLKTMANKYLSGENYIRVVLLPQTTH